MTNGFKIKVFLCRKYTRHNIDGEEAFLGYE